jgi:hypothetical protein
MDTITKAKSQKRNVHNGRVEELLASHTTANLLSACLSEIGKEHQKRLSIPVFLTKVDAD